MNPTTQPTLTDAAETFANAIRPHRLLCDQDTMPRVTTVLSADTELELERIAAWMNRYPLNLADRAKAKYGLIDIVNVCPAAQKELVTA